MTKAENRAAAKAYRQEKLLELAERVRADAAQVDLDEIGRLRRYLITSMKSRVDTRPLVNAIDDMAEKLTGDRTALHEKPCKIG